MIVFSVYCKYRKLNTCTFTLYGQYIPLIPENEVHFDDNIESCNLSSSTAFYWHYMHCIINTSKYLSVHQHNDSTSTVTCTNPMYLWTLSLLCAQCIQCMYISILYDTQSILICNYDTSSVLTIQPQIEDDYDHNQECSFSLNEL